MTFLLNLLSSPTPPKEEQTQSLGENLEYVPKSNQYPAHLVAHGTVRKGMQTTEIKTAISKRNDDIEFSSNFGRLQNNELGDAIEDRLNQRLDGKFVKLDSERSDQLDLVYTTRRPGNWLDKNKIRDELEHHAKAQELVRPVIELSRNHQLSEPRPNYSDIRNLGADIVDTGLDLQSRSEGKVSGTQYFPSSRMRSLGE